MATYASRLCPRTSPCVYDRSHVTARPQCRAYARSLLRVPIWASAQFCTPCLFVVTRTSPNFCGDVLTFSTHVCTDMFVPMGPPVRLRVHACAVVVYRVRACVLALTPPNISVCVVLCFGVPLLAVICILATLHLLPCVCVHACLYIIATPVRLESAPSCPRPRCTVLMPLRIRIVIRTPSHVCVFLDRAHVSVRVAHCLFASTSFSHCRGHFRAISASFRHHMRSRLPLRERAPTPLPLSACFLFPSFSGLCVVTRCLVLLSPFRLRRAFPCVSSSLYPRRPCVHRRVDIVWASLPSWGLHCPPSVRAPDTGRAIIGLAYRCWSRPPFPACSTAAHARSHPWSLNRR